MIMIRTKTLGLLGLLLLTLAALSAPAQATDYTWGLTTDGNWNVAANWSPNGVPGTGDNARIDNNSLVNVTVSVTA